MQNKTKIQLKTHYGMDGFNKNLVNVHFNEICQYFSTGERKQSGTKEGGGVERNVVEE